MIILKGEKNIRQFKIYLEVIKSMYESGYSKKEIQEFMLVLEKEITCFRNQKRDVSAAAFRHLMRLSKFKDGEQFKGVEILNSSRIQPDGIYQSNIRELFDDEKIDINRIDEIVKPADILVKYNVEYVEIGNYDAFNMGNYFLSTVVPDNYQKLWFFEPKNTLDRVPIFKTYSNQEITYTNLNDTEEYYDYERNASYHYLESFKKLPEWVISGKIQIFKNG